MHGELKNVGMFLVAVAVAATNLYMAITTTNTRQRIAGCVITVCFTALAAKDRR